MESLMRQQEKRLRKGCQHDGSKIIGLYVPISRYFPSLAALPSLHERDMLITLISPCFEEFTEEKV